ncbi:MAG TPA: VWA domain-containing protein [Candidatus Binatia bacterium]|nr:VWA domain-containing protein [Candidatus Binatia bacterium]
MPAPWEAVILKVDLFLFSAVLLSAMVSAQTSVNDVHIVPRAASTPLGISTVHAVSGGSLSVIRTNVKLVLVPVSVTDEMQRVVTGLSRDNFEVFDGKKPQTIQDFSSEDVPVSVGIILDSSGSMQDKWDRVRDAVNQFCDTANPDDEFFMVVFSDQPRLSHDFTTSTEDLQKDLLFTQPKGRTALLDAIQMGLRKMKRAKYGKKALLIISDGGDNHSRYNENEIKSIAKESDVMIYSIGVFDRYVPTLEEAQGPELLTDITEPTGGRAFTLENASEMPEVARHIGMELRTQYVLAYRPQDVAHDGKWHRIKVKLRLPKRLPFLQAHAKTGYYASQN